MEFEKLLKELRFGAIQPEDYALPISDLMFQRANLLLPADWQSQTPDLMALADVPRMGTWPIALLLAVAVRALPPQQAYLNIGVWHGFSLLAGMLAHPQGLCIGVDNFCQFGGPRAAFLERFARWQGPRHRFEEQDYLQYFAHTHREPIGVYFFDGPHTTQDQRQGLELAAPFVVAGGLIFVDDSNLTEVRSATLAFLQEHPHYRLLADFRTAQNAHPTWWNGLMILQKTA